MTEHVYPLDDEREHVLDGEPCPCLPRARDGVVTHNSYDGREIGEVCARVIDMFGKAHRGAWSAELRDAYEHAMQVLEMHYDIVEPGRETNSGAAP